MLFGVLSDIPNVIIHAKFHVDRLRGFWATGPPKVPFRILIGTTLTAVLHYRADCDTLFTLLTLLYPLLADIPPRRTFFKRIVTLLNLYALYK